MLTHLTVQNFKSWKNLRLEFGPLTALFGANSSGKSSILQFLLLLKQTKDTSDRQIALDFGSQDTPTNLGSFQDAAFSQSKSEPITWKLCWSLLQELAIADPAGKRSEALFRDKYLCIESVARLRGKVVTNDYLRYRFDSATFSLEKRPDRSGYHLSSSNDRAFKFIRNQGRPWELPGPSRSYAFPDQARTYFQNSGLLSEFENAYVDQMDHIYHLGPLREHPKREYTWTGTRPTDVGSRGEKVVEAVLAATDQGLSFNLKPKAQRKPFQEIIAYWLKAMGLIESFRVEEIATGAGLYRVRMKKARRGPETLITDVGFGVSQVLPALVLLYYAPEGSTILLEQPEIHLHPAVQTALADVIVAAVKRRNIQVILESHSEHLLQRLQRRIAEGENSPIPPIYPSDVKLYFCRLQDDASSTLDPLELNLFGGISNWPQDFFGDSFSEIAAREEAALQKKAAAMKSPDAQVRS